MSFHSTTFHYDMDERPSELNCCLYQWACGETGLIIHPVIWLQIQESISARTLREDLLYSPFQGGCSQNEVPRPAASAPPDNLLHMQILRPHADLLNGKSEDGASNLVLTASRPFWCSTRFRRLFPNSLLASDHFDHRQVQTSKPVSFPWL